MANYLGLINCLKGLKTNIKHHLHFARTKDVLILASIKDLLIFAGIEDLPGFTFPESRIS